MNIMLKSICRFAVMGLGLAGFAPTALAGESQTQPAPHRPFMDYDGSFRVMGQTDEESDSDCIGDMSSPLCAFESKLAAVWRMDSQLLDIATGKLKPEVRKTFKSDQIIRIGYRIISVRHYISYGIPAPENNKFDIREGDIAIFYETCNATYERCSEATIGGSHSDLLRKGPYGWHVVPGVGWRIDLTDLRENGYYIEP